MTNAEAIKRAGILIVVTLFLAQTLISCPRSDKNKGIVLQREWTANAEYAGDVWASKIAPEYGITLSVREGSEILDPVSLVRSRKADFGVTSADRILRENEGGSQLVIVASATYKTPVVFLSQKNSGITEPQDFVGKTVGIQAGTNTELVFEALLKAANVDKKEIRIVESGWGIQTFQTGAIDVLGAFAYDEPVQLDLEHIGYYPISPEIYGVNYVGTVYFTRKELIDRDPELVQKFLTCLVAGWMSALKDPDEAMKVLAAYNHDINIVKERESFQKGKMYFRGEEGNFLASSEARWRAMATSLIQLGRLKSFDYAENIDYSFLVQAVKEAEKKKHG